MSGRPAASVVVPLFNKRATVGNAVASVLAQSAGDFEVLVVDDGSTDGGAGVVRALADRRVRVISQANAGAAAARNRGVAASGAPLVAFLDADDRWDRDFLETVLRLGERFPDCALIATGYRFEWPDGTSRTARVRGVPPPPWEGVVDDYFAVAAVSDPPVCSSAVAVRRDALDRVGGFPEGVRAGEDLLTWARLAARYPVAYSPAPRASFRRPAGERPAREPVPDGEDRVGAGLRVLLEERPSPTLRRYLALWHTMRASVWLRLGRAGEARRDVAAAARAAGWTPKLAVFLGLSMLPNRVAGAVARGAAGARRRRAGRA